MTGRRRSSFDERSLAIARRLYDWDVLGVYSIDDGPDDDDEYDDLVMPIRGWLEKGTTPAQLSIRLVGLLRRDYGLPCADDFAELELARSLCAWWQALPAAGDR
jgi:hypothetical protein